MILMNSKLTFKLKKSSLQMNVSQNWFLQKLVLKLLDIDSSVNVMVC